MLLTQATFYILITIGNIVTASTPECGPRDMVAARRTCKKACLHDGNCKKKIRECVCDGLCGLSCLRKRCPILTAPLNGNMIVRPIDRTIGAEVSYSCNDGYVISGQTNRICQANKTWSGTEPTCTDSTTEGPRRECAERDEVAAARTCGKPCKPDGTCKKENRVCVCDGLCGLTCFKKIPCPLLELSDGILEYRDENDVIIEQPNHGDIRTATCSEGYVLSGVSQTICSSGEWQDALPSCQRVPCPILDLEDGALAYLDENNRRVFEPHHGDIRVAVCKDGSSLLGTSQTQCISGSWQDELPLCEVGLCNMNDLPIGDWNIVYDYPGGRDESAEVMKPAGTVARLTCNETGYVTVGHNTRTCRRGEWDGQNPSCERSRCQTSQLEDGMLRYYDSDGTVTLTPRHGDYRIATCDEGYSLEGTPRTGCFEEEWIEELPTCQEITCPYIQFPHGRVTYQKNGPFTSNRGHTATAHFNCPEGYTLEGHTLSCHNGVWNDTIPTCVEKPCYVAYLQRYNIDVQYEIPTGSNEITAGRTPAGTTAYFNCRQDGFEASQTKRCERGRWAGADPVCLRIPCDDEPLDDGVVTYTLDDVHVHEPVHGVMRSYNCNAGYTVDEDEPSQCDAGSWTKALPICNENPCSINKLPSEDWDIVYNHPERRHELAELMKPPGTVAILTCNRIGYVTAGTDTRTCRQGEWDGQNPPCVRSTCPSIQLENGILEYRGINNRVTWDPRHGDSMRATCDGGYYLQGPAQRLCWDGQWENEVPFCIERPCDTNSLLVGNWDWEIQYTLHGRNEPERSMMSPRTVARLRCNITGYETVGRETRTCSRGEWTGQNPLCERRICPSLQLDNGRFEYRDSDNISVWDPRHGDLGSATCNRGYYRQGEAEIQCWDGQWKDELPTCLEEPCNKNDLPTGGWEIEFNYPGGKDEAAEVMKSPGTVARFKCNVTGYAIDGDDTRLCSLGQWDGPRMSCERSRCQITQLEDGRLRYYDSDDTRTTTPRHGDYRVATCNEGYSLEGTSRTQCLEGQWIEELPTCQENPCSFLNQTEVPDYLQVTYTTRGRGNRTISSSEGSVPSRGLATFTCREEGFVLSGVSHRTCKKGTWRGEFPECVMAHCSVETIINGGVTRGNGDPFTQEANHGDSIRFTCEQGYTLTGDEISHCDAGEWNPGIPTCVEASCSAVENNGKYENMYYQGRRNPPGASFPAYTQLEVECAEGRVPEGPRMSECRRGLWEPSIPLCVQAAPCEEVPQEEERTVAYTDNTGYRKQHNSNLAVTCERRMVRFGQNTSTCLNGTWSPPVARCKENHALNKQAYQDSIGFGGSATLAVDGNTDGSYMTGQSCSHTRNDASNHWWYVDLGSSILVTEIVLYNRQEGDHHARLLNAKVRVGEHRNSHVIWNDLAGTVTDTEVNPIRMEVNPAIKGRIVSVSEVTNGNPLTLCEVQVFGEISACLNGCEVPPLEHGYFTNRPNDTPLNPKDCVTSPPHIYAHCQEGWTLPGSSYYYTCHQSGEWHNPERADLTCERCRSGQCLVPYIENGHFESTRDGTTLENGNCLGHSEYLRIVCDNGMQLNGSEYYQCTRGLIETRNTDNVSSSCRCQSSQCVVPYIENGHYSATRDGHFLEEGTCLADRRNLYVVCHDGMQRHGSFYYHCNGGELLTRNNDNVLSSCSRVSNVQERRCPNPGQADLVETFVGSDFTPLNEQEEFREGDFITSRCQNTKRQKFRGSVTRFCEGGGWSGGPAECEPTNFVFSVGNTVIQNVTENGTIIVYPVRGYVTINCHLNGLQGTVIMSYQGTSSVRVGGGRNRYSYRIYNPSQSNSGRYQCESNGRSHSITVLFEVINCPPPSQPSNWNHNRVPANSDDSLGYIFTETLSLRCPRGFTSSNPIPNKCTYHGTWSNMSQRCIRNQRA